jgi:hypothetical protein
VSPAAALPYAVFALLVFISWQRWIQPYVDTGRELMVPWRLAHGERLYRDVHFHHGPLGPYLAAISDGLAGRSLPARTTLYALVALLHVAALDRLARRMLSPWRAALATSSAIAAAVFLWPGGWLFPFSFDTALAVAALTWALVLAGDPERPRADVAAGLFLLAALLSRPELGLAGVLILAAAARRSPRRLVPLAAAPLAAAAAGYAMLSTGIPRDRLVADGWLRVIEPPEAFQNVYRAYAGLDRVGLRTAELLLAVIVLVLVGALLAAAAWIGARLAAAGHRAAGAAVGALAVAALLLAAAVRFRPPASLAERLALVPPLVRVIPACLAVAAALRLYAALRGRSPRGPFAAVPEAVLWMAAVFGARMLLAAGYVGPYDAFFLPLPVLVAAAGLFGAADRAAPALGAPLPRLAAAALAVFLGFRLAAMVDLYRGLPWAPVATPAGNLRLPAPVAGATAETLGELSRLPANATLAGFPEAGFFNYVLGLRNPFWLEQFFPGHLDARGESRAVAVLEADPPDALIFANVLAVGEGARAFGQDYLGGLAAAARARYRPTAAFGPGAGPGASIGDPQFFVEIAKPLSPRGKTNP